MSNLKPKIAFLGTGGTISYTGRNSLDVLEYMDFGTRLNISEILSRFPEVEEAADIVPINVRQVSSSGIVPDDWLALSKTIQEVDQSHDNIDGIVITHGTATLEETAYFINLTAKTNPIFSRFVFARTKINRKYVRPKQNIGPFGFLPKTFSAENIFS